MRVVGESAGKAIAVIALAERAGLFVVEGQDGSDLLDGRTVYRMTPTSLALAIEWGLDDDPQTPEEEETLATAFLLLYSREVGMSLVPDVDLHLAIDQAAVRLKTGRENADVGRQVLADRFDRSRRG